MVRWPTKPWTLPTCITALNAPVTTRTTPEANAALEKRFDESGSCLRKLPAGGLTPQYGQGAG